eukprot:UN02293
MQRNKRFPCFICYYKTNDDRGKECCERTTFLLSILIIRLNIYPKTSIVIKNNNIPH